MQIERPRTPQKVPRKMMNLLMIWMEKTVTRMRVKPYILPLVELMMQNQQKKPTRATLVTKPTRRRRAKGGVAAIHPGNENDRGATTETRRRGDLHVVMATVAIDQGRATEIGEVADETMACLVGVTTLDQTWPEEAGGTGAQHPEVVAVAEGALHLAPTVARQTEGAVESTMTGHRLQELGGMMGCPLLAVTVGHPEAVVAAAEEATGEMNALVKARAIGEGDELTLDSAGGDKN